MALALTLRASKTDFSLPGPTLQAIRPVTSKARETSRRRPQSAGFSHAAPEAGMFCALRSEIAAVVAKEAKSDTQACYSMTSRRSHLSPAELADVADAPPTPPRP